MDPLEILRHFTDYGQPGGGNFPIRCFVRFHVSGDTKWVSFWERSRNEDQLHFDRTDSPRRWERNELEYRDGDIIAVEKYVGKTLERLHSELSIKVEKKPNFDVFKYHFTCHPQVIHCHYQSGKIESIPNLNHEIVECCKPENIVYNEGKDGRYPQVSLTCFNPERVRINNEIDLKPDIVTFDNLKKDIFNVYARYLEELIDRPRPWDMIFKLSELGDVAEIYLNHLNLSFFDNFKTSFPLFVHVKYASLQENEILKLSIDDFNKNPGCRIKFTPFTDSDWRILNRQIADKLGNKSDPHNLVIKHFTDFGQHGHYFEGFPARCYVRYQRKGCYSGSFWERKRSEFELELERYSPSEWRKDKVLQKANHAESYVLRKLEIYTNIPTRVCNNFHVIQSSGTTTTYSMPKVLNFKLHKKGDFMYNHRETSGTYYNPVSINDKKTKDSVVVVSSSSFRPDDDTVERLNVEMFINASPCRSCFTKLKDFVDVSRKKHVEVFIHVKYASFYYESENEKMKNEFDKTNSDCSSNLKITPFTVDDWRIFGRALTDRIQNEINVDQAEVCKKIEDFKIL